MAASSTPPPYPFGFKDPETYISYLNVTSAKEIRAFLAYCKNHDLPLPERMHLDAINDFLSNFFGKKTYEIFQLQNQKWLHTVTSGPWTNLHSIIFWRSVYLIIGRGDVKFAKNYTYLFDREMQDRFKTTTRKEANERRLRMEARAQSHNFRRNHTLRGVCREYLRLTNYAPLGNEVVPAHGPVVRGGYCADCVCTCDSPNDVHCSHYCREGCPAGKCETPEHRACLMECGNHRRHTEKFCTPCQATYHRKWFTLLEDNGLPIYNAERKRRGMLSEFSVAVRAISLDD